MEKKGKKPVKSKKPAPKKKVVKKAPVEKVAMDVKVAYRKAIDLVVKVNEAMVDGMDDRTVDALLDEVAECRRVLNGSKRNEVVGRLLQSLKWVTDVEIDEATPGAQAHWDQ